MKKIIISLSILMVFFTVSIMSSCTSAKQLASAKTGAQLWGENCLRCHNTPSPETFSDTQWDAAVLHMRVRAYLTQDEALKIADFLKTAN